jgi:hypothetical protein
VSQILCTPRGHPSMPVFGATKVNRGRFPTAPFRSPSSSSSLACWRELTTPGPIRLLLLLQVRADARRCCLARPHPRHNHWLRNARAFSFLRASLSGSENHLKILQFLQVLTGARPKESLLLSLGSPDVTVKVRDSPLGSAATGHRYVRRAHAF